MAGAVFRVTNTLNDVEWMWQSYQDPWSKSQPAKWSHYSDVENLIIEEAFTKKQSKALFDSYYIDLKQTFTKSTLFGRSFGGQYGWVSPFVIEGRRDVGLRKYQLPSRDKDLGSILVEKAGQGIVEEGKLIEKQHEAEKLAKMLMEKK